MQRAGGADPRLDRLARDSLGHGPGGPGQLIQLSAGRLDRLPLLPNIPSGRVHDGTLRRPSFTDSCANVAVLTTMARGVSWALEISRRAGAGAGW